jgi:lysophospholipase L1-like esterase
VTKSSAPPPQLSRAKWIGFTVVTVLIIAALLEGGSRVILRYTQGYSGGPLMQYVFDPYKNVLPTPDYVDLRGVRHNAQGFRRDGLVAKEKPAGTYRVFLMGASTAYGTGGLWTHIQKEWPVVLADDQTIDHYLEQLLADSLEGMRVEVINAAIPSIWMHHHLIYLNQTILGFDPDMVLFLDGFNDWFFNNPDHDQFDAYRYQNNAIAIMGPPSIGSLAYMNGWWLFRKSGFAHLTIRALRTAKDLVMPEPKGRTAVNVEEALANHRTVFRNNALAMIDRIAVLLAHEGVHAVFLQQPQLILERDRTTMPAIERQLFEFDVASWVPGWEEFMHRAVPQASAMVAETVARDGQAYYDLTGIFRDAEGQVFTDYAHLTPDANQFLARYVAQRILPTIRGDLQASPVAGGADGTARPAP